MPGLSRKVQLWLRRPYCLVSTAFGAACCVAVMITLVLGVPVPRVHDEFAYLLGADTYAHGRAVNPAHVHWNHFETFHVLTCPVYLPKYAPGQSLMLALGQLVGHPHVGVCLSTGLAAAGLAWMLFAWLPGRFLGWIWLTAVLHPGLQIKWGHSYMGGAVAMMGACLLLGALGHSRRGLQLKYAAIAALGVVILANSRPFEGAVLTLSVAVGLIVTLAGSKHWNTYQLRAKLLVPAGLVLLCGAGLMMFNNYTVTGSVFKLPYQLYETQYGYTPLFLWQGPKADKPIYLHPVMERFYSSEDAEIQAKFSSPSSAVRVKANSVSELIHFFGGGSQYMMLLGLPLALRRVRYRLAFCLLTPVLLAAIATPWTLTHYAAPAAPLIVLILLVGLIEISELIRKGCSAKSADLAVKAQFAFAAICMLLLVLHGVTVFRNDQRANKIAWAQRRQEMQQRLVGLPGKHLVFVRYNSEHNPHEEWVYNEALIDHAKVVWARQLSPSEDAQLEAYFHDRKVHVVDADSF